MKKTIGLIVLLGIVLAIGGCSRVAPGYVGIKVSDYGDQKGVSDYPMQTGMIWYNPFTTKIYQYPTFMQNVVWCKATTEGSPVDESITFNSIEGATVNVDVGFAYSFVRENVPALFVNFHQSADEITKVYLRSQMRDAFSRLASNMRITEIFGAGKQELLTVVKNDLNERLGSYFNIDMVTFTSALRLDPQVEQSINAVIQATQRAIEAENKVRESTALAAQKVAEAEGTAQAKLAVAKAEAEGNKLIAESITPETVAWAAVAKWNGVTPLVMGGSTPLIDVNKLMPPAKAESAK